MEPGEDDAAASKGQPRPANGSGARSGTSRWRQNANSQRHDADLALLRQTAAAAASAKRNTGEETPDPATRFALESGAADEQVVVPPPAPEPGETQGEGQGLAPPPPEHIDTATKTDKRMNGKQGRTNGHTAEKERRQVDLSQEPEDSSVHNNSNGNADGVEPHQPARGGRRSASRGPRAGVAETEIQDHQRPPADGAESSAADVQKELDERAQHHRDVGIATRDESYEAPEPPDPEAFIHHLVEDLRRHGACIVFDTVVHRPSASQPLGMDVKHARNKLIVKTIYEESVIAEHNWKQSAYAVKVGDVILMVNGVVADTNKMVAACRVQSPTGDAAIHFRVLRFTPLAHPVAITRPAGPAEQDGGSTWDNDSESISPPAHDERGGACRSLARCVCRPLRTKM